MKLFNQSFQNLEQSLHYATTKNSVISNNLANVDTPNYKAQEVTFKSMLEGELSLHVTKNKHIRSNGIATPYKVMNQNRTSYTHSGNNVDVDKEMTELAKNQIYYRGAIDRLNGKFGLLHTVIRGGK
ncbi:flagellar basal body rod protein FlgB [Pseudogracilibacillus sp. ICA-222130]|uniref:flagellar basal body rod protein FlgB n=1 Tax=Pseudogracilibacillus sp. ICA-222130 TaxID=3134655 RepID=UPI0030BA814A